MTKTIRVIDLKNEINRLLAIREIDEKEKKSLIYLLEKFLMQSKNYRGYTYNEIFTPECNEWKKNNPDKPYFEFVTHEYERTYI